MDWPSAALLTSDRLLLEPLTIQHADEMVDVLAPPALYEFTGGEAPSVEQLASRYARQSVGHSPDRRQGWFNWIVRHAHDRMAIGFTQATLECDEHEVVADIAWVITPSHQGHGYASEAAAAMCAWLARNGTTRFLAHINPQNRPSIRVARKLGMHMTDVIVDGENRWQSHHDNPNGIPDR